MFKLHGQTRHNKIKLKLFRDINFKDGMIEAFKWVCENVTLYIYCHNFSSIVIRVGKI